MHTYFAIHDASKTVYNPKRNYTKTHMLVISTDSSLPHQ